MRAVRTPMAPAVSVQLEEVRRRWVGGGVLREGIDGLG